MNHSKAKFARKLHSYAAGFLCFELKSVRLPGIWHNPKRIMGGGSACDVAYLNYPGFSGGIFFLVEIKYRTAAGSFDISYL